MSGAQDIPAVVSGAQGIPAVVSGAQDMPAGMSGAGEGSDERRRPIRWWWIRHAPTGVPGMIGWRDVPADLSDQPALDRRKARLPARARLLTSDLTRATATADALAQSEWTRRPPLAALREQHFGEWEGRAWDARDHSAIPAEAAAAFWRAPADTAPPGGESFRDVCDRVRAAIEAAHAESGFQDVVAVAHAGVIRAALALALDLPPARALSFALDPLSLTRLDWFGPEKPGEDGGWGVGAVNLPA